MIALLLSSAWAASLDLAPLFDASLAGGAPDAACLRREKGGRAQLSIPVGVAAEALVLRWTVDGADGGGGAAATARVRFADGTAIERRAALDREIGAPPPPSTWTVPAVVARRADGTAIDGAAWTLLTGRPRTAIDTLDVDLRLPRGRVCVTSVEVGAAPVAVRYTDTTGWYPFRFADTPMAPLGVAVEAPAGARGFVGMRDGHLVFADGTRFRGWGADLYGADALPPRERADDLAAGMARLGFNVVRLHHVDSEGGGLVNPARGEAGQPRMLAEGLDRLDYFVSRCKAHGVYLLLEFQTNRALTAADGVPDPGGVPNGHKLVPAWEPAWLAAQVRAVRDLWDRVNPHTGLRYADDPAVAVVELSNEDSVLANWGGGLDGLPSVHRRRLDAAWNEWLRARYGSDAAVRAAWLGSPDPGLRENESLATGTVQREPRSRALAANWPRRRGEDLVAFYLELDRGYMAALTRAAGDMGFRQPIVPTLAYGRPDLAWLHRDFPVADAHYEFDGAPGGLPIEASSLLRAPGAARLASIATTAIEGKAMMVSEINMASPNPFMAEAPLLYAALAALQDWDVIGWNEVGWTRGEGTEVQRPHDVRGATVKMAQMATASAMFRGGFVPRAPGELPVHFTERAALGSGTAGIEWPAAASDVATLLTRRVRTSLGPAVREGTPGTAVGVAWDVARGRLAIDRPEIQALIGAGGGETSGLRVRTAQWAAVSLAAVEGGGLATARRALIAIGTRQENTGVAWAAAGGEAYTEGVSPALVEPFEGAIEFRFAGKPRARVVREDGAGGEEIEVAAVGRGWWRIEVTRAVRGPLLVLERA